MPRIDTYQKVTDTITAALRDGCAPWVKPWSQADCGVPFSLTTNRPYRGVNVFLLAAAQMRNGYESSHWVTYKQAKKLGGHVRKGERSQEVFFWNKREYQDDDGNEKSYMILRQYNVFNAVQCDGIERPAATPVDPADANAEAERIMSGAGVSFARTGDRAFYAPGTDSINVPPAGAFLSDSHYYATCLHEYAHATGHPSRLDRDQSDPFGSEGYAFEELIAELGAAFLCAHCSIDGDLRHPAYIESWLKVLTGDPRAFTRACSAAQKAADWLIDRESVAQAA